MNTNTIFALHPSPVPDEQKRVDLVRSVVWEWANNQADRLTPDSLRKMTRKMQERFIIKNKDDLLSINATSWGSLVTLIDEGKVIDLPQRFSLEPQKQLLPSLRRNIRLLWMMRWVSKRPERMLYKHVYASARKVLREEKLKPLELHEFYWDRYMRQPR